MRRTILLMLLLSGSLLLSACAPEPEAIAEANGIVIVAGWVRPALVDQGNGAAYLVIRNENDRDDLLLSVETGIAARAELQESIIVEAEAGMEEMGEMAGMRHLDSIAVPAGETVTLEPGGKHVMLMEMVRRFGAGDVVFLTLNFEQAGPVLIQVEVRLE
jgi:hypothetical protein